MMQYSMYDGGGNYKIFFTPLMATYKKRLLQCCRCITTHSSESPQWSIPLQSYGTGYL